MAAQPVDVDVLIVGAGPTGMSAALAAHQQGLSVKIIDKHAKGLSYSRAILVNPHTLHLLKPFGVADRIIQRGQRIQSLSMRTFDGIILSGDIPAVPQQLPGIGLAQLCTEQCFLEALAERGIHIQRPAHMFNFEQDAQGVTTYLNTADSAEPQAIRSRYLIGADGFSSRTRQLLGIDYHQADLPYQLQVQDAAIEWPFPEDMCMWLEDVGVVMAFKLSDHVVRFAGTDLNLLSRIPQLPAINHIIWQSNFDVHFAQVAEYGRGRVWLAGDAAHVHSPIGGRGMNMGIADGISLGNALATGQFADYAKARHKIASAWVKQNRIMTSLLTDNGPKGQFSRRAARTVLRAASGLMGDKLANVVFRRVTGS